MSVAKVTCMARVIVTIIKSGTTKIKDEEIALSMLQVEDSFNDLTKKVDKIVEGKIILQPYPRVHLLEEVDKKGDVVNGNDKDKDLA